MSPRVSGFRSVRRPGVTKAVLAGVVATTLGLAACGSDDDGGEESSSNSSASSSTSSSAPASSSAEESASEDPAESAAPEDDAPAPEPEAPEADGEGAGNGTEGAEGADGEDAPPPAPAAAPQASGDDAAQITALEEGFGVDRPYGEYMRYTVEHTCNADIDQLGGRESAMQDANSDSELANTMASEVAGGQLPVIHGVNDIRVDGDRATANLDQTMNGNRQTLPKNYVREDGQWRTCVA